MSTLKGKEMSMKEFFVSMLLAAVIVNPVMATVNTLTLVGEYKDGSDKICIYSDGHRTEAVVQKGAGSCPSKKIFK